MLALSHVSAEPSLLWTSSLFLDFAAPHCDVDPYFAAMALDTAIVTLMLVLVLVISSHLFPTIPNFLTYLGKGRPPLQDGGLDTNSEPLARAHHECS